MKKILNKSLALVGLLALSIYANASIIDNGNYTTDTLSGLDWLDLTETTGRNYNEVYDDINNSGGDFGAGEWRYASQSEFQSLLSNKHAAIRPAMAVLVRHRTR